MPQRITQEQFIERANNIHKYKYDYTEVIYKSAKEKILINCPVHGKFSQSAWEHTKGQGCPLCGIEKRSKNKVIGLEQFINISNKIHNYNYDYTRSIYTKAKSQIEIVCKKHGSFFQVAWNHMNGIGCKKCSFEKMGKEKQGVLNWSTLVKGKKCILYLLKLENEKESFYKIGITSQNIKNRIRQIPYNITVLLEVYSYDAVFIYNIEQELHKELKPYRYYPRIKFGGMYECFLSDSIVLDTFCNKIKILA